MKRLYNHNGQHIDNFDSVDQAILGAIMFWHEEERPSSFTVIDEEEMIAATLAPVGSDRCVVVFAHGDIHEYTQIHYHKLESGRLVSRFYFNGSATMSQVPG